MSSAWRAVAVVVLASAACAMGGDVGGPPYDWEDQWGAWRNTEQVSLEEWRSHFPVPKPVRNRTEFLEMEPADRIEDFDKCITQEAKEFTSHVLEYRSPKLAEVKQACDTILADNGWSVHVAVFWGRGRYVRILWPYIERNLRVNGGSIDKVVLITKNRDHIDGATEARAILERNVHKYPGVVVETPFCKHAYGCAYDQILNDPMAVYIKIDDDIVFVKDGAIEHLVYQVLTNKDYTFYSGAVVNNPHSYGVHSFAGAFPPTTFHWKEAGRLKAPFVDDEDMPQKYWGKTIYDGPGSKAHESFIWNAAVGKLNMYNFDLFNFNECLCAKPQEGMGYCIAGAYRWSINAIAWTYNVSSTYGRPVPSFDEPFVTVGWTTQIAPHRAAMVGEALFAHAQFTRQRSSKPDYGLNEDVILPWYKAFQMQYVRQPFGQWPGNYTLLALHEDLAKKAHMRRFGKD